MHPKYVYNVKKHLDFKAIKPTIVDKSRIKCSTSATIEHFFNNILTEELLNGIPSNLIFNADETHVEVGTPSKVIVSSNSTSGVRENKFENTSHITAMITINAAGDDFEIYVLIPWFTCKIKF